MFYCDKCENTDCCERTDLPNEPVLCDKCYLEIKSYNKATDDFVKGLKEYMENEEQSSYIDELSKGNDTYSAMPIYDYVDDLAEQLKSKFDF